VAKIANFTALIQVYVQKEAAASKGKRRLRPHLLLGFYEPLQGKVGHHVSVIAEDGLVFGEEIFDVFQSARRVQKNRFMAKDDGHPPPLPVGKFFRVYFRAVVGIYDETIHARAMEMIHRIRDEGAPSDLQERFRTPFRQRAKPHPQSGAQDEGGFETSSGQITTLFL
jgi:hypothetical protein